MSGIDKRSLNVAVFGVFVFMVFGSFCVATFPEGNNDYSLKFGASIFSEGKNDYSLK